MNLNLGPTSGSDPESFERPQQLRYLDPLRSFLQISVQPKASCSCIVLHGL